MQSTNKNSSSLNWEKRIHPTTHQLYTGISQNTKHMIVIVSSVLVYQPNYINNSLTESSDERDSTSLVRGQ